jgi:cytoskeletal protein CcmA (bactofilin family)
MLDSNKRRPGAEGRSLTIVGQGTTITGDIKSKVTVRVEGHVQGRIHSDDSIVIQETGKVKAELVAQQIVISGEVEGNVFAHDRLEVTSNGKLIGDITAPKVSIAEGVIFEGKCTMKSPQKPGPASGPRPEPARATEGRPEGERKGPPTP